MLDHKKLINQRLKRKKRVRGKIIGTTERPRLMVFRSNKHMALQVIDDSEGKTLAASTDVVKTGKTAGNKTQRGVKAAQELLKTLKSKKIENLVFDRSYYKYHGRVKAIADTLREGGINL